MAGSRRSPPADARSCADIEAAVAHALARALPDGGRVAVALSGGRDSTVLLDATAAATAGTAYDLVALHVHHGLSPNADAWSAFCRDAAASRGIACKARAVDVRRGARVSVEAAARAARYAALGALAREHRVRAVLLAHHADDQAETVLIELLRGAGPRGLAAMPAARLDDGIWWLRPLLAFPRAELARYAAARRLAHVDDESNDDPRYRRNALRMRVVPALRAIAPGYPATLVRCAAHQAEAAALLDDLARLDARSACDADALDCAVLRALDPARARNLLRWFLRERGLPAPSSARLAEMLRQVAGAKRDARTTLVHAGVELGVHRGRLRVHGCAPEPFAREWSGARAVELAHGTLVFAPAQGTGIAARLLDTSRVTIRNGVPGERLRPSGRAARRAVADLLREAGIPRWDRVALPRVYCGDVLAAVAEAGVDSAFAAAPGEPAFALEWRPRQHCV